jgi:hypothetical protein
MQNPRVRLWRAPEFVYKFYIVRVVARQPGAGGGGGSLSLGLGQSLGSAVMILGSPLRMKTWGENRGGRSVRKIVKTWCREPVGQRDQGIP